MSTHESPGRRPGSAARARMAASRAGLVLVVLGLAAGLASAQEPTVTIGARATVIGAKAVAGLEQFPEAPISIVETAPELKVVISAGTKTLLCKGATMQTLKPAGVALAPSGAGIDVMAAHITGTWKDPASGDIYGIFKGWDPNGVPRIPGADTLTYPGRYWTIGLVKSTDGGTTFQKLGPILNSPKNASGAALQGDGHGTVLLDKDKQYNLLYYTDWHGNDALRGVQICLARSPAAQKGAPGSWTKYRDGAFNVAGLSAGDSLYGTGPTPVIDGSGVFGDAMYPHVVWSEKARHYIMVYSLHQYFEPESTDPVEVSGIYMAFSTDGINWTGHKHLVKAIAVDWPGKEVALYPTLVLDEAGSTASLKATLYYGYAKEMWTGTTQYLVSHSLDVGPLPFAFPASVKHSRPSRGAAGDYVLSRLGAGEFMLDFPRGKAEALRLVGADGRLAGRIDRLGESRYRLSLGTAARGMHFLQGRAEGLAFTRTVMLP